MTERRRALILDGAIVLALAATPVLIERLRGLEHAGFDIGWYFIPNLSWWWSRPRLLDGWSAWVFSGYPMNANPQIASPHPFNALWSMLPPLRAAPIEGCLGAGVAGLGMLAYLRRIGCGRVPGLVGALSFALGGFVATHGPHLTLVRVAMVIPWALLAIEGCRGAALFASLGFCVAAILLGGHPQASLYALVLVAAYAAWARWHATTTVDASTARGGRILEASWRSRGPETLPLLAGLIVGVGIAAMLWLPGLELARASTRALGHRPYPDPRLSPFDFVRMVVPFAGGGGAPFFAQEPMSFSCSLVECGGYPGELVLLALLGGVASLWRDPRGRFWLVVAAVALAASTGVGDRLLVAGALRGPARMLLWWSTAAAAGGALGLDRLLRGAPRPEAASRADRPPSTEAEPRGGGLALVLAAPLLLAPALWLLATAPAARAPAAVSFAIVLASIAALEAARRVPARSAWLVLLLGADLLFFNAALGVTAITRADFDRIEDDVADLATAQRARKRPDTERGLVLPFTHGLDWAPLVRAQVAQGYDPLVLGSLARLLGQNDGLEAAGLLSDATLAAPQSHVLDLLRVGIVARVPAPRDPLGSAIATAASSADAEPRWQRDAGASTPRHEVFFNPRARGVAWLVGRARSVDPEQALSLVRGEEVAGESPFDPDREALVTAPLPASWTEQPSCSDPAVPRVSLTSYQDDRLELHAEAPATCLLVTSELAYAGWGATVDAEPSEILSVNAGFRAVVVPAGAHRVVLRYAPSLPRIALAISLVSALSLVAGFLIARRREQAHRTRSRAA